MRSLLQEVFGALDAAATRRSGRREHASNWVHLPEQAELDLEDFLREARTNAPSLPSLIVHRRPDAFLMVNVGKVDSAIGNTTAVIVAETGLPYGKVFDQLLKRKGTDEELLAFLDKEADRVIADRQECDQSAIPREIIRAKQKLRSQMDLSSLSMVAFLEMLDRSSNLIDNSDDALLSRLLHIAPEENKSIAKRIEATRLTAY